MRHTCEAYCMEISGSQEVANLVFVPVTTSAGKITGDRGPGSRSRAWASDIPF
ncbi:unnamed protein product [Diplocarpon coronariae]